MNRLAIALVALGVVALGVVAFRTSNEAPPCGAGFIRSGSRCNAQGLPACPTPLVASDHGCDEAERDVVRVPPTTVVVGPADWEAEGRVGARVVKVAAFAIDRLEVSSGRLCSGFVSPSCDPSDPARAANGVSLDQARAFCKKRGGRLPSDDEWLAAAGGDRPRRYPWGDTGAVCRRAAWGLEVGPCAEGADGPDTVGAHPEGVTPLGVHDLAGNVAEWVESSAPAVRGGSWKTRLATGLRTWLREEVSAEAERGGDPSIGFRCAYDE